MRIVLLTLGLLVAAAGCSPSSSSQPASPAPEAPTPAPRTAANADLWFRYAYVGAAAIEAQTNGASLKAIWALPETETFKQAVLGKLAKAPKALFTQRINTAHVDRAPLFRPLLDDLIRNPSMVELRGNAHGVPEWTLAVRLENARAGVWDANLRQVMKEWDVGPLTNIQVAGCPGWQVAKHFAPNRFQVVQVAGWLVAGLGQDRLPATDRLVAQIHEQGAPAATRTGAWLTLDAKLDRLRPYLALPEDLPAPELELSWAGRGANVRTTGRILLRDAMPTKLPPWQVPTNTIREPLVSFTAARGVAPWLASWRVTRALGLQPAPDQLYGWALSQTPFQTFLAMPVPSVAAALEKVAANLPAAVGSNALAQAPGQLRWQTNKAGLYWEGFPFAYPHLRAAPEPVQVLMAGIWPRPQRTDPMPAELLAQLSAGAAIVYYQWELTQVRAVQWQGLLDLRDIFRQKPKPARSDSSGAKWLLAAAAQLRNAATEITQTNARELAVTRTSQLGLTGCELAALAKWLDDPQFPLAGYELPKRPSTPTPAPGAPAARTPAR